MTFLERRSIVNGIWLCAKCHKLVDNDEVRYTVARLFEWKRQHEADIEAEIGGGALERKIKIKKLRPFDEESEAAYQIALDQPELWEYFLTVELMRSKFNVTLREFADLERGLVYRPSKILDKQHMTVWMRQKTNDLVALLRLMRVAATQELPSSWGPPGQPGDALEIKRAVDKLALGVASLLEWEIDVYFTRFPDEFESVRQLIQGWSEHFVHEVNRLPQEISKIINQPNAAGRYEIDLVFEEPENANQMLEHFESLVALYGL